MTVCYARHGNHARTHRRARAHGKTRAYLLQLSAYCETERSANEICSLDFIRRWIYVNTRAQREIECTFDEDYSDYQANVIFQADLTIERSSFLCILQQQTHCEACLFLLLRYVSAYIRSFEDLRIALEQLQVYIFYKTQKYCNLQYSKLD